MNFPAPPSNPIATVVTEVAGQVVEATASVVDVVADATEHAVGGVTTNTISVLRQGRNTPGASQIVDRTASLVSQVRVVVDGAAGQVTGSAVHAVMAAISLYAIALGSAAAAGVSVVRIAQGAAAVGIAIARFVALRERENAASKIGPVRRDTGRLEGEVAELLLLIQRARRAEEEEHPRPGQDAEAYRQILDKLAQALRVLTTMAAVVDPGPGTSHPAPAAVVQRLERAASKLDRHLARQGSRPPWPEGFLHRWTLELQRPPLPRKIGVAPPTR